MLFPPGGGWGGGFWPLLLFCLITGRLGKQVNETVTLSVLFPPEEHNGG